MVIPFVGYGYWFGPLVMMTCSEKEKTKLVGRFAKSALGRMVSSVVIILIREILAKIMGVVAEMKDSPCFSLLPRVVHLADAGLFPGGSTPSSRFFPSVEGLESSPG